MEIGTCWFPAMRRSIEEAVGRKATAITSCCGAATDNFASESSSLAHLVPFRFLEQALERGKNQNTRRCKYSIHDNLNSPAFGGSEMREANATR